MSGHKELLQEFERLRISSPSADAMMRQMVDRLHKEVSRYNWVGFYLVDPTDPNFLIVGPFTGSFTPNERIPLNRGLCGAAASSGQTVIVNDVSKDPRYLAGTDMVKSEIVVPILVRGKVVGELDVESYFRDTFNPSECQFVEACAALVGKYLASGDRA